MKRKILFTGGGSSGHVTPNLALIEEAKNLQWECYYIGSYEGIEKDLIKRIHIPYFSVHSGKLRRYFSWKNFIDPLKILTGVVQSYRQINKIKPHAIFSKGGFVAFPVVLAAWLQRIPVVVHESDFYPGLANKLSFPFATTICVTFPETAKKINYKNKIVITGTPIRKDFFKGNKAKAIKFCNFSQSNKKTLLILGGGQGSQHINEIVQQSLSELLKDFNIIHICGKNKINKNLNPLEGYRQFEYLYEELYDVMALANIVISRAGANSLYELLVLQKPHILIPLSKKASRGDQIDNALYFTKKGLSTLILEEDLTKDTLLTTVAAVHNNLVSYQQSLNKYACKEGTEAVISQISKYLTLGGKNVISRTKN